MDVILTGTYSSSNKGDLAMQLTASRELVERGISVVASVPFPCLDREVYAQVGVEVFPSNRRKLIRASWQVARLSIWQSLRKLLGYSFDWLVLDNDISKFRSADLVIDLSGDMLTDDYGPHVAFSHFLPMIVARLTGTPYVVLAQSIGPFRYTTRLARSVLCNAAFVSVRDSISVSNVERLGVSGSLLTADLAFLLPAADDERVAEAWRREALPSGKVLGVSVSGLVASHYQRRNPLASRRPFHSALAEALDAVADSHNLSVVFFPHVTGPSQAKDDRIAAAPVAAAMKKPAYLVTGDHHPDLIKGMIARCNAFLGARMHANISALSSGIPTIAIGYSHKSAGIMQQLGCGDYVVDITQLDTSTLIERLETLFANTDEITANLATQLPGVQAESARNIEAVMDLLDEAMKGGS